MHARFLKTDTILPQDFLLCTQFFGTKTRQNFDLQLLSFQSVTDCMNKTYCFQEIPENGADFAHFFMLHEDNMLAGGDMQITKSKLGKLMTHKWTPKNWTVGYGEEKHMIKFDLHLETYFGQSSIRVPGFNEMKAEVRQVGSWTS